MVEVAVALERFKRAAIEWAAGGRGQPLVDAAAQALVDGLDTPTLRVLAGAPHSAADEEAEDLGPAVFDELGVQIHERRSTPAAIEGARLRALRFLEHGGSPRDLARDLWRIYEHSGYPEELSAWSGFDDWYSMLESGIVNGNVEDVDRDVSTAARALVGRTTVQPPPLAEIFVAESTARPSPRTRRWWRQKGQNGPRSAR